MYTPTVEDMFPDAYQVDKEEVFRRVKERWDLTGPLPVPKWDVTCPICLAKMSEKGLQGRIWNFHMRGPDSRFPHRCDVSFKCRHCSFVMTFGVVVPEAMHNKARTKSGYSWREAHIVLRNKK